MKGFCRHPFPITPASTTPSKDRLPGSCDHRQEVRFGRMSACDSSIFAVWALEIAVAGQHTVRGKCWISFQPGLAMASEQPEHLGSATVKCWNLNATPGPSWKRASPRLLPRSQNCTANPPLMPKAFRLWFDAASNRNATRSSARCRVQRQRYTLIGSLAVATRLFCLGGVGLRELLKTR